MAADGVRAVRPSRETMRRRPLDDRAPGRKIARCAARSDEIEARCPKVLRRVAGYNLDMPRAADRHNLAQLLVGSEGTLALLQALQLKLRRCPGTRCSASCHFPSFYQAMDLTQHIVKLEPAAVELVDRTMIELSRVQSRPSRTSMPFVRGEPDAILLVEFAGDDRDAQPKRQASRRADGRPGLAGQRGGGDRRAACRRRSGRCARPASTS